MVHVIHYNLNFMLIHRAVDVPCVPPRHDRRRHGPGAAAGAAPVARLLPVHGLNFNTVATSNRHNKSIFRQPCQSNGVCSKERHLQHYS